MKTEIVKCHELVENDKGMKVKKFVGEGPLEIAESIEDILQLHDKGLSEEEVVSHFNASRRIAFQRQLKDGGEAKVQKKQREQKINALFEKAKHDEATAQLMREMGLLD